MVCNVVAMVAPLLFADCVESGTVVEREITGICRWENVSSEQTCIMYTNLSVVTNRKINENKNYTATVCAVYIWGLQNGNPSRKTKKKKKKLSDASQCLFAFNSLSSR